MKLLYPGVDAELGGTKNNVSHQLDEKKSMLMSFQEYLRILRSNGLENHHLDHQFELMKDVSTLYRSVNPPRTEPSREGVSLRVLQKIADFLRGLKGYTRMTTGEVWEHLLQPMTIGEGASLLELIASNDKQTAKFLKSTRKDAGTANIFVSHAWRGNFCELVMSLSRVETDQRYGSLKKKYYWIDLFSNNQYVEMHYRNTFYDVIADIKRTVIILHPWKNPVVLTRCWCLWEVYCSMVADASIEFIMSRREEQMLRHNLREALDNETNVDQFNFAPQTKWYPDLALEEASAYYKVDEDFIKDKLETLDGGYDRIKQMVLSVLKNLYAKEILFTAMEMNNHPRAKVNAFYFLRSLNRIDDQHLSAVEQAAPHETEKKIIGVVVALFQQLQRMQQIRRSARLRFKRRI